ncbi:retrovirus-related pol polyprotein from transposon TNT 1-94 [Tanacetum coccineum]|uniref:Retrovirus-related pol polyprotein from transposon TNT 1-94 n=1 Tax=Tanacetum coccineum TaxID=301880 RepID=A0ABQ4XJ84_9ASTR
MSINHKKYTLIIVDEYSRTGNETEFRNSKLESFCEEKGISNNFSSPYTPEQNGVDKRKNITLIEAARTMLNGSVLSKHFWTEAVRIACYTQNRSIIVKRHDKTPYKIFKERIPDISYFHVFGCHVFIHNHKDHLGKFDIKAYDGYFLGYSFVSKALRVFNTRRQQIEETYYVTFDESMKSIRFTNTSVDEIRIDDLSRYPADEFLQEDDQSRQYQANSDFSYYIIPHGRSLTELIKDTHNEVINSQPIEEPSGNNTKTLVPNNEPLVPKVTQSQIIHHASTSSHPAPQDRWSRDQHIKIMNIISEPTEGMLTRSMAAKLTAASASECLFADFLFEIEPKKVSEALKHPGWVDAMQEELNQFYRNKIWTLVPLPYRKIAIGFKWVFRNKKDELRTIVKNKSRLVAQGFSQEKGISYDETFAPVARMEAIRIFIAFATYMNFIVFQMDIKSAFLNDKLKEEVYVKQPSGFKSSEFFDFVCKLNKAIYGLKQAPKAWHETLSTFLFQNKFIEGGVNNTLFIYRSKGDVLLVQVLDYNNGQYVDHPSTKEVKAELAKIAINEALVQKNPILKTSFPIAWRNLLTFVIQGMEVGSIRRIQGIGYGVLEFLGVGTTFDIFQNLYILYLQYGVLIFSGYGVLGLFPLWSLSANEETRHAHSTETPTEEPISIEHRTPSLNKDYLESSKDKKTDASDSESSSCSETFKPHKNYMSIVERQLEKHEEVVALYADLKWSIDDFHRTTFRQYENTEVALRNYQQIITLFKSDHNTGIKRILDNL